MEMFFYEIDRHFLHFKGKDLLYHFFLVLHLSTIVDNPISIAALHADRELICLALFY